MDFRVVTAGDACVVVVFDERIDPVVNARCIRLADALRASGHPGVRDVIPTYHTVAVCFDPVRTDLGCLKGSIEQEAARARGIPVGTPEPIEVPVCYGGEFGPDLAGVAALAGRSEEEVIRLHSNEVYRVYMLGFLPGFAYMGRVNRDIAVPRLPAPRARVPAGSVGIAGVQTGVYPMDAPGGWRIIGRTSIKPFDPAGQAPFRFAPGDRVRFLPAGDHTCRDGTRV